MESQRTGGNGLGGIPRYEPERGVIAAGEVDTGDLQVATIDVTLVERDAAIDAHLRVRAAAHRIVGAFHHGAGVGIREGHGTILGVVFSLASGLEAKGA